MPQSYQAGEFNSFVGGLVTEASPLAFPENGSLDELNMVINNDSTRRRRLGMDYLPNTGSFASGTGISDDVISVYDWQSPGNSIGKEFTVVQLNTTLYILDKSDESLKGSGYLLGTAIIQGGGDVVNATFASVDGILVVASGRSDLTLVFYNPTSGAITTSTTRIKIRDLFGIAATVGSVDTWRSEGISYRPSTSDFNTDDHIYNLRNQGWMEPRARWFEDDGEDVTRPAGVDIAEAINDPIRDFIKPRDTGGRNSNNTLPSLSDPVTAYLYPRTDISGGVEFKDLERFDPVSCFASRVGNYATAKGYFIIDLFNRGTTRKSAYQQAQNNLKYIYGKNGNTLNFYQSNISVPTDRTEGGVKVVGDYAGRVWYAGIDGKVTSGDNLSPNLSSYLFYSQQVKEVNDIGNCYQDGDPTSKDAPDRLDTDGGFIRIAECTGIQKLVNIGSSLLVMAKNGVWAISGSDSGEFTANNQSVTKVTEHGTTFPQSVSVVEGGVMYWSDEAIYQIAVSEVGEWTVQEISSNVRDFYQAISAQEKQYVRGFYDSYDKKVRWVYSNSITDRNGSKELVFDLKYGAFTPLQIGVNSSTTPSVLSPIRTPAFTVVEDVFNVISGTDNIIVDTDEVVMDGSSFADEVREVAYLAYSPVTGNIGIATYNNQEFLDWKSVDNVGADAAAYLLTGYIGTGDNARYKQVPYIYFHFLRTETGFVDDGNDLQVVGESSCLVQSQWDWSNSVASGKWGREFQAYRYKRAYMPSSEADGFDTGAATIVSKNKLRGRGRVLSLKISTEPGKDLQLLGWSMAIGTNNNF